MRIVNYGVFCVLVLVASVLVRRPADVRERETTPVESVETSGQVMKARQPRGTTERAETGAEMIKGQQSSMTPPSDEDDEEDGEDEDDDEDDEDED